MKKPVLPGLYGLFILVFLLTPGVKSWALEVSYTIDTQLDRISISPYIYGSNAALSGKENLTFRRIGGNRLTGYNWETNYSNAGNDWYHSSDQYLVQGLPSSQKLIPGIVLTRFQDECLAAGQASIITLQMAGYVSADRNGTVTEAEVAPSPRWKEVVFAKGSAFCSPANNPDRTDGKVYMDECVNMLVSQYGNAASARGVKFYSLDNEPALWASTHARIHPTKLGCAELITRSTALSKAIKNVDPQAGIFGGVFYGFTAFLSLQDAPDWSSVKGSYSWYLDYYLAEMKKAQQANNGNRLIDVLDLHWYPEAKGDGVRITDGSAPYTRANAEARMQAPRTLWDSSYTEDSWIGQWYKSRLPLITKATSSINTYYPGTKLAFTEYNYGGNDDISGGVAIADVLGIFGKYGVYASSIWHWPGGYDYSSAAFCIYRNYDGQKATFGDTRIRAGMSDKVNSSIYGSMFAGNDTEVHLVVMNKSFDQPINGAFQLASARRFTSGRVWAFDQVSNLITERTAVSAISANKFNYTIPPLTVCHFVLLAPPPPGDLNGSGLVDTQDLTLFIQGWRAGVYLPAADLNQDNAVNFLDYGVLSRNWLAGRP